RSGAWKNRIRWLRRLSKEARCHNRPPQLSIRSRRRIQIARWKNPARRLSSLAAKHQYRQVDGGDDAEDFSRRRQISEELSLFLQNLDRSTRVSRAEA